MQYECRRLGPEDLELALGMNAGFRPGLVEREQAAAFLADRRCWLFAAVGEGQVIAFAYGYRLPRLSDSGEPLYVHEVGVMEAWQRRGVGTRLMEALKAACRADGIPRIFLTAYQSNAGANALYRKTGGQYCPESQGKDVVYWFDTGC